MHGLYGAQGHRCRAQCCACTHIPAHTHTRHTYLGRCQRSRRHAGAQQTCPAAGERSLSRHQQTPADTSSSSSSSKPAVRVLLPHSNSNQLQGRFGHALGTTPSMIPTSEHGHLSCAHHPQAHHANEGVRAALSHQQPLRQAQVCSSTAGTQERQGVLADRRIMRTVCALQCWAAARQQSAPSLLSVHIICGQHSSSSHMHCTALTLL